jgi:hypothetical protein
MQSGPWLLFNFSRMVVLVLQGLPAPLPQVSKIKSSPFGKGCPRAQPEPPAKRRSSDSPSRALGHPHRPESHTFRRGSKRSRPENRSVQGAWASGNRMALPARSPALGSSHFRERGSQSSKPNGYCDVGRPSIQSLHAETDAGENIRSWPKGLLETLPRDVSDAMLGASRALIYLAMRERGNPTRCHSSEHHQYHHDPLSHASVLTRLRLYTQARAPRSKPPNRSLPASRFCCVKHGNHVSISRRQTLALSQDPSHGSDPNSGCTIPPVGYVLNPGKQPSDVGQLGSLFGRFRGRSGRIVILTDGEASRYMDEEGMPATI